MTRYVLQSVSGIKKTGVLSHAMVLKAKMAEKGVSWVVFKLKIVEKGVSWGFLILGLKTPCHGFLMRHFLNARN